MNLLAHYIISNRDKDIVIGGFIADHVKGKQITKYNSGIIKGIKLHRKIDTYSDNHKVVKQTWALLKKDFGHYGRVITDIYYDHFLCKHWDEYSKLCLEEDIKNIHSILLSNIELFPPKIQKMINRIVYYQWLSKYSDLEELHLVFRTMAKRLAFENNFEIAVKVLEEKYDTIHSHFNNFFPDLNDYAKTIY